MEKEFQKLKGLDPSDSMSAAMDAIADLLGAVEKDMDNSKAAGALELIRKKDRETRDYYMRPLDDDSIYHRLIQVHSVRGEVDLVDSYRRCLDLRQARKWTILGDSIGIMGNNMRAVSLLKRALFFGPMDDVVDEVRSALEKAEKRVAKASQNLEKSRTKVEADPDDVKALKQLASYLLDLDMMDEAVKINNKALKMDKMDFDNQYMKGCILFSKGKFKESKNLFEKLKEANPKSMNAKRAYNWSVEMLENHP
ncbi:MAG: tetratricopeptide repeat protein [Thermoplasmatota archaeon]